MNPYTAMAEILRKAQGHTSTDTGEPIDVGYEVMTLRKEIDQCRRETASFESMLKERDAEIDQWRKASQDLTAQMLDEMRLNERLKAELAAVVNESFTTERVTAPPDAKDAEIERLRMEYAEYREVSANESDAREAEIERLREQHQMLRGELEWNSTYSYCTGWPSCPLCGGIKPGHGADEFGNLPTNSGHKPSCFWSATLAKESAT
jgi:predicted RNase H-like nuclease (RuvC/YqgF family)